MLLSRTFAQRRTTLLAVAGALVLCTFFIVPQGQAFASSVLLFLRGQVIQPVPTTSAALLDTVQTLKELEHLGTLSGTVPASLNNVSSAAAAASMAGFTPAQPNAVPNGYAKTPSGFKALAPSTVTLTLSSRIANEYFKSIGSSQTLPKMLDGEQIIVNFPGVTLLAFAPLSGGSDLDVGQAGQLVVNIAGNASADQLKDYLLTLPGLSSSTIAAVKNFSNWQYAIPLAIPTDRAGWSQTTVSGTYGGSGVILNDNTGIASAVVWQRNNGTQSLGVGGKGLTAAQVQSVASSLR